MRINVTAKVKVTNICALFLVLAISGTSTSVRASLITSASGGSTTVDFSQFSGHFSYGSGPVEIGGLVGESITWQANTTFSNSVIGSDPYNLFDNGNWEYGRNGFTGLNEGGASDYMEYIFNNAPVSSVSGYINYIPDVYGPALIEVLGDVGQVLESYDLTAAAPISTPSQTNAGAFRGISRGANDIYAFRVSGAYTVLDDLSFSRNAEIPVPAGLFLILTGLFGLICFRPIGKL